MTTTRSVRHRHILHTTISAHTGALLAQAADDTGITNRAALIDYIVSDWVRLKTYLLQAAASPDNGTSPEPKPPEQDPEPVPA